MPRRLGSGTQTMVAESRSVPLPTSPASVPTTSLPFQQPTIYTTSAEVVTPPQPVAARYSPRLSRPTSPQPDLQASETIPPPLSSRNEIETRSMGPLDDGMAQVNGRPNNPIELPPAYEPLAL
ncbi:hypothetical protein PAXRUDRAFT_835115 [Paxillus rubicundulus Ve08.2h10]|uniref:Uncharacterized protein n=1 Tax=Paxillus rubicundulus Ve08.2h10 TaxID=930991 RepID=A0A0D0C1L5_9AGAM|nr:hypothetical protein PAXRUDRAFT_835115 [Paxillus rubicundulus Ve08.2h10]